MKAKPWKGQVTSFAHQKYDGINLRIARDASSPSPTLGLQALTRTPHNIIEQLKSCAWMLAPMFSLPRGAIVYGELYIPGAPSSQVSTALASSPRDLRFAAFAIEWNGITHDASLLTVDMQLVRWGFATIPYLVHESLRYSGHGGIGTYTKPEDLLSSIPEDVEGYVMKNGNLWDWYKLKPVKTIDLIVTDFTEGKDANLGLVGSLRVETMEGIEVACVSGMDFETRLAITEMPGFYRGKVCEVRYQYVGAKGRLRHPAFVRWRDDKSASECTLSQDEELLRYWNK